MRDLIITEKTGFRTTLPFTIMDCRGNVFYSDEFTNEIAENKVLNFNMPKGNFKYDGYFIKLPKPVIQTEIKLPAPERNYDKGKIYKISYADNPNKCSIFYDKAQIIFDNSFKTAPVFIIYDIYFHELGHLYYETDYRNSGKRSSRIIIRP